MSDGMSDSAAESQIYSNVWRGVYDVRNVLVGGARCRGRFSHSVVTRVNELLVDFRWRFERAQYAEPVKKQDLDAEQATELWSAVEKLGKALYWLNVGHRGWTPTIDPEVDGLLRGTGYVLVRVPWGAE